MKEINLTPQKTPLKAIRAHCIQCVGSPFEIMNCRGDEQLNKKEPCCLYAYRLGKGRPSVKVLRKFCLECMQGNRQFVKECATVRCHLHQYRMGKNPNYSPASANRIKQGAERGVHGQILNIEPKPMESIGGGIQSKFEGEKAAKNSAVMPQANNSSLESF